MSAVSLIAELHANGIRLVAANDGKNIKAQGKPLTPELRQRVLAHKAELLERLHSCPRPAANDSTLADWKTLDRAYLAHHAQCHQCRSAGRGYGQRCGTGSSLWRSYEVAPTPFDKKPKPVRKPVQQQAMPPDLADLLQAAMLACDFWGDGAKDREAMRQHCMTVPIHQRRDLMAYFVEHYGEHSHD